MKSNGMQQGNFFTETVTSPITFLVTAPGQDNVDKAGPWLPALERNIILCCSTILLIASTTLLKIKCMS